MVASLFFHGYIIFVLTLHSNVEALCRQVYLYLQRVAKERDRHYEVYLYRVFPFILNIFYYIKAVIELSQERDFYKSQQVSKPTIICYSYIITIFTLHTLCTDTHAQFLHAVQYYGMSVSVKSADRHL